MSSSVTHSLYILHDLWINCWVENRTNPSISIHLIGFNRWFFRVGNKASGGQCRYVRSISVLLMTYRLIVNWTDLQNYGSIRTL